MNDFDSLCQSELQAMDVAERAIENANNLTHIIDNVVETGEFGMDDVIVIESLMPGLAFENYPTGGFSAQRSTLNASIGLEMAMDAKRLLLVGGIAALFGAIFAAIRKFTGGGGGSGDGSSVGGGGSSDSSSSTSNSYSRAEKAYKDVTPKLKDVQKKLREKKQYSKTVEDALSKCYHAYVRLTKRDPGLDEFIRLTKEHPDKLMPHKLTSSMFSEEYLQALSYDMFSRQDQTVPRRCVEFVNGINKTMLEDRSKSVQAVAEMIEKNLEQYKTDPNRATINIHGDSNDAVQHTNKTFSQRFNLSDDYLRNCQTLLKEEFDDNDIDHYSEILADAGQFIQQCFKKEERVTFTDATFESFWTSVQRNASSFDKAVEFTDKLMKGFATHENTAKKAASSVDDGLQKYRQIISDQARSEANDPEKLQEVKDNLQRFTYVTNRAVAEIKSMVLITGRIGSHTVNINRLVKNLADHIEAYDKAVDKLLSALDRDK